MKKIFPSPIVTPFVVITVYLAMFLPNPWLTAEEVLYVSSSLKKIPIWETLIRDNPLPPGITIKYTKEKSKASKNILTLSTRKWYEPKRNVRNRFIYTKELKSAELIPLVSLLDSRSNIDITRLRTLYLDKSLKADGLFIIPLKKLTPVFLSATNLKALLVNNKTPFEKGYKLADREFLKLETTNSTIISWFKKISPNQYWQKKKPKFLWLLAVGDVMLARGTDRLLLQPDGVRKVFGNTLPYLRKGDILLGNLECVASLRGHKINKSYNFHFDPSALKPLKEAGFSYLSVANNHSFDYGISAFLDTLKNLHRYQLGFSGAGGNLSEASKPWVFFKDNLSVKILSVGAYPNERTGFSGSNYTANKQKPGILWANDYFFSLLKEKFGDNSLNIVMVHGGIEWRSIPTLNQVKLYRKMVDSGADIVIGSHPHFVQGFEKYRGKFIAYSLGNFLFPGMEGTGYGDTSIILKLGIYRKQVLYIIPIPVRLDGKRVRVIKTLNTVERFYHLSKIIEKKYH